MSTFWWGVVVYVIGLIITPFILYYEECKFYVEKRDNGLLKGWENDFDAYMEEKDDFFFPTIFWPILLVFAIFIFIDIGVHKILTQIRNKTGVDK